MTDDEIAKAKHGRGAALPTVLGAVVVTYNVPEVTSRCSSTAQDLADIFIGNDHEVERRADRRAQSGREAAASDILVVHRTTAAAPRSSSPTTSVREHHVDSGAGDRARARKCSGRSASAARERRRRRTGEADAGQHRVRRARVREAEQPPGRARAEQAPASSSSRRSRPSRRPPKARASTLPRGHRLPRLDRERAGRRRVPDLVVHVAARLPATAPTRRRRKKLIDFMRWMYATGQQTRGRARLRAAARQRWRSDSTRSTRAPSAHGHAVTTRGAARHAEPASAARAGRLDALEGSVDRRSHLPVR